MASKSHDYTRDDVDYDSTNEDDEETRNAKRARRDLADKPRTDRREKAKAGRSVFTEEASTEEGRRQRFKLSKLNAYDRHKQLINTYQVWQLKTLDKDSKAYRKLDIYLSGAAILPGGYWTVNERLLHRQERY